MALVLMHPAIHQSDYLRAVDKDKLKQWHIQSTINLNTTKYL